MCYAGVLQHAIQQQPSLSDYGCRCKLHTEPSHQGTHAPHRLPSPSLSMHSGDAELLMVSVQLKTGYLRVGLGKAVARDEVVVQLLKQVGSCDHTHTQSVNCVCMTGLQEQQWRTCLCFVHFDVFVVFSVLKSGPFVLWSGVSSH